MDEKDVQKVEEVVVHDTPLTVRLYAWKVGVLVNSVLPSPDRIIFDANTVTANNT